MEDSFSMDGVGGNCSGGTGSDGGDGSGGDVSNGERRGAADEASLTRPPLTSCCAAGFLTDQGPVPVCTPGIGDPWSNLYR